jgi:hypothetical protein
MGSRPREAENANRLKRLLTPTADRIKTDVLLETALFGQRRRSKTMKNAGTTELSREFQAPTLLNESDLDVIAGGGTTRTETMKTRDGKTCTTTIVRTGTSPSGNPTEEIVNTVCR